MKKTLLTIGVSSILLAAIIGAVVVNRPQKDSNGSTTTKTTSNDITPHQKLIRSICNTTDYKETCEQSLSKSNTTNPKTLVQVAFNETINQIRSAMDKSSTWQSVQNDPRTKQALGQCKELMTYAIHRLISSFDQLGHFEIRKVDEAIVNLKIWLSSVLADEKTCLEGFEETQGDSGEKMKELLNTAIMLTHNGLAMVDKLAMVLGKLHIPGFGHRKLLEDVNVATTDGMPAWVDSTTRRLLQAPTKPDIIVAKDGSGQFSTINEALKTVPQNSNTPFVMHIKEGIYKEYVEVNLTTTHLVMVGDGGEKTKISGALGFKDNITTYMTTPFAAIGNNFVAKNMGFENTAGPEKHQALAIRVLSDMAVFYNCIMDAYQDTLNTHSLRHYYRDCTISGTVDFIFGDAAAVFQNCNLKVRKPLAGQQCLVTAQGRLNPRESTGYVFQGCTITAEPDYLAVKAASPSYLGRPWKVYSRTIFMTSFIPDFIHPDGWMPWHDAADTLFYSEYKNTGPGANVTGRVKWAGIKTLTDQEALEFTPAKFIQSDEWVKPTGVPYSPGMQDPAKV